MKLNSNTTPNGKNKTNLKTTLNQLGSESWALFCLSHLGTKAAFEDVADVIDLANLFETIEKRLDAMHDIIQTLEYSDEVKALTPSPADTDAQTLLTLLLGMLKDWRILISQEGNKMDSKAVEALFRASRIHRCKSGFEFCNRNQRGQGMKDQTLSLVKLAQELCNSGHTPRDATGHLLILAREHAELAYLLDADQEQAIAELERRFSGYVVKPWECRYIIETPNQLWGGYSWDNTYPVTLQDGSSRHAKLHQFADLAIAKEVLSILSRERGGAKLKIYQLADDEQRVEVQQ